MANRTIARLYDNYEAAAEVVRRLEAAGVSHEHISLIANNEGNRVLSKREEGNDALPGSEIGAGIGGLAGGGVGLLTGLGLLAIPGVGPVVAAGWLAAMAVGAVGGAAAGGLIGGLAGSGISKEHAEVFTEGVRRGGALVSVRTSEDEVARVEAILEPNAVDTAQRRAEYTSEGWSPYDPDDTGLTEADADRLRKSASR